MTVNRDRELALDFALRSSSAASNSMGTSSLTADNIVKKAETFETYLTGGAAVDSTETFNVEYSDELQYDRGWNAAVDAVLDLGNRIGSATFNTDEAAQAVRALRK